ncbi:MAG: chemotaxis protein CheW [Burkholderiales bacterium]|nr:chemotaxis protein CheW [Burkholderiales bacterium]
MALDISRFAKAFFEEAQEHVGSLETFLISVDIRAPDDEALNAIFRAVHSVKGGAAAFGHMHLAEFTHDFESILDRVRKRKLALTKPMVDVFLKAGDAMGEHLDALSQDLQPDLETMARLRQSLLDAAMESPLPFAAAPAPRPPRYHVAMQLNRSQFSDDAIADLKKDISGLGLVSATTVTMLDEQISTFAFELDAEIDADELRESLEFLASADDIEIDERGNDSTSTSTTEMFIDDDPDGDFGFFAPISAPSEPPLAVFSAVPAADADIQLSSLVDATSIRVNVVKVDQLINLVGELVIAEAMVALAVQGLNTDQHTLLTNGLAQLSRNTRNLQDAVLAIRMMPISFVFSRLPRLTRDLADRLGKEVELELHGEDTELDKSVIEKIADPLTHLVRNALDHGIESPEQRVAVGKPRVGHLTVRATHQGGNIVITVTDDGAGLNREKILVKAREVGLDASSHWQDDDVWRLIFTPGFSTAATITDVSGRGVGMDVVWQNVHSLGGKIDINSVPGVGTTMTIRLPLTLAILDGMSVSVSGETYILPLASISHSVQPLASEIKTVNGARVLMVRGEYIPITSLAELFNLPSATDGTGILVILEVDDMRTALQVDELIGQMQVVLKSLEANYRRVKGVSGATILGDGRVALILDATYLVSVAHSIAQEPQVAADKLHGR